MAFAAPPAVAVDAEWVLTADVPLVSRSPADQKLALQEGMRRVLVRMSGRATLPTSVPLSRAFAEPHLYARQITAVPTTGGEALRVTFNEAAVASLLKAMGMPMWSKTRPQVVVWAGNGNALTNGGPFVAALQAQARARGVPLLVPRLDAVDRAAITGADVQAHAVQPAVRASARYAGEMVLIGTWREGGGGRGTGDWLLVSAAGSVPFRASSESAAKHAEALAEWLVGVASGRAATPGLVGAGPVRVVVDGVASVEDYAGVFAALNKVTEVRDVQLTSYAGTELTLAVSAKGSGTAMLRALSAAPDFAVDLGAGLTAGGPPELRLRWAPRRAP